EMFRLSQLGIEGTVKSIKMTVNYEVMEGFTGENLYLKCDGTEEVNAATVGQHTGTISVSALDFFCLKFGSETTGTVRVTSVVYEIQTEVIKQEEPETETITGTLTGAQINKHGKGTVGDGYVEFSSETPDKVFEMFNLSNLNITQNIVSIKITMDYEVVSLNDSGLHFYINGGFTAIPATAGNHTATIEPAKFDFFCIYFGKTTYGTVRVTSVTYEIVVEK
ncbi:MAG: hypothetical protein IJR61_05315, partial [Clostridia bacterium]|nr:hypothetical protein [Clostridia bacterium]